MNLCNSMRHDCSYIGSSDLNAKTVCAVLFLLIAAGPLFLELSLDRFAGATFQLTPTQAFGTVEK